MRVILVVLIAWSFTFLQGCSATGTHHGPDYYEYTCDGELRGINPFTGKYPKGTKIVTCTAVPKWYSDSTSVDKPGVK